MNKITITKATSECVKTRSSSPVQCSGPVISKTLNLIYGIALMSFSVRSELTVAIYCVAAVDKTMSCGFCRNFYRIIRNAGDETLK